MLPWIAPLGSRTKRRSSAGSVTPASFSETRPGRVRAHLVRTPARRRPQRERAVRARSSRRDRGTGRARSPRPSRWRAAPGPGRPRGPASTTGSISRRTLPASRTSPSRSAGTSSSADAWMRPSIQAQTSRRCASFGATSTRTAGSAAPGPRRSPPRATTAAASTRWHENAGLSALEIRRHGDIEPHDARARLELHLDRERARACAGTRTGR